MHRFLRSERVALEEGKLVRIITGDYKGNRSDVAKIYEDDEVWVRNIGYFGWFGWLIDDPSKWDEEWYHIGKGQCKHMCCDLPSERDKELIISKYPEMKYLLAKAPELTTRQIFALIPNHKAQMSATEALCAAGYTRMAMDRRIPRIRDKKAVLSWLKANPDVTNPSLHEILGCLKNGCKYDEFIEYCNWNFARDKLSFDEYLYIRDKGQRFIYRDYLEMAAKAGHDLKDPYWHYPKDLKKAHDKVMRECKRIDRLREKEKMEAKQKEYYSAIRKLTKMDGMFLGLRVWIPETIKEIERQASKLHQCLVTADYIGKVAKGECVLVFVADDSGKPIATCELKKSGRKYKIGQFYGDERRKDYMAPQSAKDALNKWADNFNVKIAA